MARIQGIRIHAHDAALHVSCCNSVFHATRCFPMKNSCSILVFHPSCMSRRYQVFHELHAEKCRTLPTMATKTIKRSA